MTTVKPLEWSSEPPYSVARVSKLFLLYSTECVWNDGKFEFCQLSGNCVNKVFPTPEAARAAAQADYEARILSALSPSSIDLGGEVESREDFEDRLANEAHELQKGLRQRALTAEARLATAEKALTDLTRNFTVFTVEDDAGIKFSTHGWVIAHWGEHSPQGIALLKLDADQRAAREALASNAVREGDDVESEDAK